MVKRAGVPMDQSYVDRVTSELGKNDAEKRRQEAEQRKQWEEQRNTADMGLNVADGITGRSALSRRESSLSKPDLFMNSVMKADPDSLARLAQEKETLQNEMASKYKSESKPLNGNDANAIASNRVAELIATAGTGTSFRGETLGIGGLDDVLAEIRRRVWTPLAAPPQLLKELGIHPVRGLLLYGKPGCGKTLLARTLANILSPLRPITVVSGPEIMDKFVGSSEKNLREIFDSPPDIYDKYRIGEKDGGEAIARAALHIVVMDEFDAVARTRGGRGGKGDQGDAGVARDSVVNQLLAKMDGVHPLPVPTLVIGLTNKRSLIEPGTLSIWSSCPTSSLLAVMLILVIITTALLRPGRFEVQVEVPPPRSLNQRVSILKVHTQNMHEAGRILVNDPPSGSAADRVLQVRMRTLLLTPITARPSLSHNMCHVEFGCI
jgi:SpoVK/Ycf46/Vps4 family AAA+-type ATPase